MMLTRRRWIEGAVAAAGAAAFAPSLRLSAQPAIKSAAPWRPESEPLVLDIAERMTALPCFNGASLPLWTFAPGPDAPVVRMRVGETLSVVVNNGLTLPGEHVSIHWHGLRIPNGQDGVSYMTQAPINPGESGAYAFAPPDTGTFFFHTHCNSVEHFGRGLIGALIVEGDAEQPADFDLVLMMKDWRVAPDGEFLPFTTDEGAAKAGTPGVVRAINGVTRPRYSVPSSADIRIRVLNVDPVRISEIGFEGAAAVLIAVDGNALAPIELDTWRLGPASRLDILLRSPDEGGVVQLLDYFAAEPVVLAEFVSEGAGKRQAPFAAAPLRTGSFTPVDYKNAERVPFEFSATATGQSIVAAPQVPGLPIGKLCLAKRSFWAINKQSWASADHEKLGPPLAKLKRGSSYIFELENRTPHSHPIHIHGHTFEVLSSTVRELPRHRADTVLLVPKERIEIAFVADNPGRWMFHCHILEHQETGMMGYIDVT